MELSKRLFKLFQVHFSIFNLLRTTDTLLILKYKNGLNHVFYKNKDVFMSLPGLLLFSMPNNRTWRKSGGRCVDQFSRVLGSWGNSSAELRTPISDLRLRHPTANHNSINNNTNPPLVIARCACEWTRSSSRDHRHAAKKAQ